MADDRFKASIEGLSRALRERWAAHPDPVGEAMERRQALQAELERQERRGWTILGGGAAVVAVAGIVAGILYVAQPTALVPSVAPVAVAAVAEAAPPPPDTPVVVPPPAPEPAPPPTPAPVIAADPVPVAPAAVPLDRAEVREVQTRLLRFGFDPGPVDGDAGRLTQVAAARYVQNRGASGTGDADRALLEQLRQDPAPQTDPPRQVASRRGTWRDAPPQSGQPVQQPPARRPSSFLESLRSADNTLSRWLNGR